MIKAIKKATGHFLDFHKGTANIVLHIIGFAGVFYSIYKLTWLMFAISLLILEAGHIYNHFAGIKAYDLGPRITAWRIFFFLVLLGVFYLISSLLT